MTRNANPDAQPSVGLPIRLTDTLESYKRRVWAIKFAEGLLAAVVGLTLSYLLVFIVDRFIDTPAYARGVILVAGSLTTVVFLPLKIRKWVWSHRRLDQVACLVRRRYPRFGDHLLGIIELAQNNDETMSPTLVRAAIAQVDQELDRRNLDEALPDARHRQWGWAAALLGLLAVGLLVFLPAASRNALSRWITPWRAVDRFTFAQLIGQNGNGVVPYAEPFTVSTTLRPTSPWRPAAAQAQLGKQPRVTAKLVENRYTFQLPPQTETGFVRLRVGDAREEIAIRPMVRPALTEIMAEANLPAYLQLDSSQVVDARGGTVRFVEGSTAVFRAKATRALESAYLDEAALQISDDSLTSHELIVTGSAEYQLRYRDSYGLEAREPQRLRIEAQPDAAPTVGISSLKNNRVVLSTEVLTFGVQANDDFGIKRVGFEWHGIHDAVQNPEPTKGEKLIATGGPSRDTMQVAATFTAEQENVPPQSMRVRAYVEDYRPARGKSYSPYVVLHVLSPEDHFNWLTQQMTEWSNAAQEVYEQELKLNATNEQLASLSAAELATAAQRQQLKAQAAAERANAAQLSTLVDIGKHLVEEAMRNEEFTARQLEDWAQLLKTLEAATAQQMPSIADLLQQAAQADPRATPPASSSDINTSPTTPRDQSASAQNQAAAGSPSQTDGNSLELDKPEKYGPDATTPPESANASQADPNTPAASVNVDRSVQPGGTPGNAPANPTPNVADQESGFNESDDASDGSQVKGGLGLPTTTLKGGGSQEDEEATPARKPQSNKELVLKAVTEQEELLEAFRLLADEMNKLLLSFENSTFVKRLKAASRKQMDIAVELNNLDGFGVRADNPSSDPDRMAIAKQQIAEADTLSIIQEDLLAFTDRRPSKLFQDVVERMLAESPVEQIRAMSETIEDNSVGQSTIESEFWADTLDRWAEQLVEPPEPHEHSPPHEGVVEVPNLTPEIVLEVLRVLDREIQLREQTRELDQQRAALTAETYQQRGHELADIQLELAAKSRTITEEIEALPQAFHKVMQAHIKKLLEAAEVMDEAAGLLAQPATDGATIAAISEVIEILLETARAPNAPMVAKSPPTTAPALMLLGIGDDTGQAYIVERAPEQATGKSGRQLPEEFQHGLDLYLNALGQ